MFPVRQDLSVADLRDSTITDYNRQLRVFIAWFRVEYPLFNLNVDSVEEVDRIFAAWVIHNWDNEILGLAGVRQARAGLNRLRAGLFVRSLRQTDFLLRNWARVHTVEHYRPIPLSLLLCLVLWMFQNRRAASGVALLLGFECLLRPSELMFLRKRHVLLPRSAGAFGVVTGWVCLSDTKTGPDQSAPVRSVHMQDMLYRWILPLRPGDRLFGSLASLRRDMAAGLAAFGLGADEFQFYPRSLRVGGASQLLLQGCSVDDLMDLGRWRHRESARPYLQQLRALAIQIQLSGAISELASHIVRSPQLLVSALERSI